MLRRMADPGQGLSAENETDESLHHAEDRGVGTLTFHPSAEDPSPTTSPQTQSTHLEADQRPSSPYRLHRRQATAPDPGLTRVGAQTHRGHSRRQSAMTLTGGDRALRRQGSPAGKSAERSTSREGTSIDAGSRPNPEPTSKSTPPPAQTRSGFLASVSALAERLTSSTNSPYSDEELLHLDIQFALHPPSSPKDGDAAAYKSLQANATLLLQSMQNAYRQRTAKLREVESEQSAEREETDEYKMRAESLRTQLETMATKATEQERALHGLMEELSIEKKARLDERTARVLADGARISEDLDVDERNKWRKSGLTIKSDVSFETDEESAESESVFSRSRSPTMTTATESTIDLSTTQTKPAQATIEPPAKPKAKEMTTFQKLFKGMSGESTREGTDGCQNCQGQSASVAWDTVSLLRDENKDLKHRVAELEVGVDGALDFVNGIGL